MGEVDPLLLRQQSHEVLFDLLGIVVRGEAQAATEPADVGVDHDASRQAEGGSQHDVGGLASHAGQGVQGVQVLGDFADMVIEQGLRGGLDVLGFVAEEAGALHGFFDRGERGTGKVRRAGISFKQFFRY